MGVQHDNGLNIQGESLDFHKKQLFLIVLSPFQK